MVDRQQFYPSIQPPPQQVSLDTHVSLLEGTLVWAVAWGLFQVFSFKDGSQDLPPPQLAAGAFSSTVASTALMYGASEAFGLLILLLLVSESIGQHHLDRALRFAGAWGLAVGGAIVAVMRWEHQHQHGAEPADDDHYNPATPSVPIGVYLCLATIAALYVAFVAAAVHHARTHAPDRISVRTYGFFVGSVCSALLLARLLLLPAPMHLFNGFGLCVLDMASFVYFALFAPVVYETLKADSSYWMHDDVGHGLGSHNGHASSSMGLLGLHDNDDHDDDSERRALVC